MSMRKIKRSMIKAEARKNNYPGHEYLTYMWNELQIKLRGVNKRSINMSRGTHPKRLWPSRVNIAEGIMGRQRELAKAKKEEYKHENC